MTPDIRGWRDIDAAWLTALLKQGDIDAAVADFQAERVGTGQIGDCVRFTLSYDRPAEGAPRSLVGKFPSEAADSRATGVALGNYYREVRFYQQLQDRAGIATPLCYFTDVDEDTHDFVLMMEDLAPAQQGDQLGGVDLSTARDVVKEAARLHGAFWNDETLDALHWVGGASTATQTLAPEAIAGTWPGFVDRYGERVSARARAIGDAMSANMERSEQLRGGARTLIHGDFRPDNMMFDPHSAERPVVVVDWQSFGYGPGAADVGYFLAGALSPELRRENETDLLKTYCDELERCGGGPYGAEELDRHYVAGAYQLFMTAFFAAMVVTQTQRGDRMFLQMLNGAVGLIHDRGGEALYS